ncbi:Phenylacetic acid catabolic protein [Halalkalicoccus jeotgali]|uniref:Phenylacetic acid catabolic family protein n=1 Tax=Halalkalicoccus jeotgali (strain DSM 18796 / CECT 7217 / JCM 14584 / KCTC 4019 / B3) TaxID=795797 RepID=D8JB28_HALJB|nr:Phenylacetic acid catabolic protein [Halalkalicoccus jeotgali]ADJ16481.1 phenylacetic acid catabolic family protein [Halalkalicoccus jeotgali B3]ELY41423.1 phenylacetic acid catabolic family protein [Halalkalicoccus jeotgali B3]
MSDWPEPAADYVQAIADTKLILGHRNAQWSLAGPSLEDDIGGASAAQEEIGHFRQFVNELQSQGREKEWLNGQRDPEEFNNAACLDRIEGDWPAYVASIAPADRASWYMIDAIDREDMTGLITKMGEDEYFHLEYHDARLEALAEEDPETIQATLETTLPQALAFIGPAEYDDEADPLTQAEFTDRSVAEIRDAFADHYRDLFAGTAVSLDNVDWDAPAREEWDEVRRRVGGGSISETDARQLRGTKNELFAMD